MSDGYENFSGSFVFNFRNIDGNVKTIYIMYVRHTCMDLAAVPSKNKSTGHWLLAY